MRTRHWLGFLFIVFFVCVPVRGEEQEDTTRILKKYFENSGGLEKIKSLSVLSAKLDSELYNLSFEYQGTMDGKYRLSSQDRIYVHDGKEHWISFHGLVCPMSEQDRETNKEFSLPAFFFHNLLNYADKPASLLYKGKEIRQGQNYEVLGLIEGTQVTSWYFNQDTGLVDKIISIKDDPVYFQRENVYSFSGYQDVGGIKLFTTCEAYCITTGETIRLPFSISSIRPNSEIDASVFTKPAQTVNPAIVEDKTIKCKVVAISGGGSLITNVTVSLIEPMNWSDGTEVSVRWKESETKHRFLTKLDADSAVESGDYLVIFNETPLLWIVKAFVGMNSVVDATIGDDLVISVISNDQKTREKTEDK